jgi:hypothetical protein
MVESNAGKSAGDVENWTVSTDALAVAKRKNETVEQSPILVEVEKNCRPAKSMIP